MAEAKDIKSDSDGDLFIDPNTGDFAFGLSDEQHIEDIIDSDIGHYKEFPALGAGIENYVNSSGTEQEIARKTKLQLQGDGYNVSRTIVEFDPNGNLTVSPNAIRN